MELMADRGFKIESEWRLRKVSLNIASFIKDYKQLREVNIRSRHIASVRIHVERCMDRIKIPDFLNSSFKIP